MEIDTLLINGRIYTMKEEGDRVEAVGVDRGRIVFAGDAASLPSITSKQTIDLKGRAVFPGFGDSHLHFYAWCQNQATVRLEQVKSLEEMAALMKRKAAVVEKGNWIKGTGFDHTKFSENRMPTRHDLDRISTEHPIVIRRCCLHVMVANSLAMQMTGFGGPGAPGPTPAGRIPESLKGLIELDADGTLNGIFHEEAADIFDQIVPDPLSDSRERKRVMAAAFRDMVSKGLTSFHTYVEKVWSREESPETYRELEREGTLPLRVVVSRSEWFDPPERPDVKDPLQKVRCGSYKLFTDGSLGAGSAALTEPYSDDPGNCGILAGREELILEVREAFRRGLQPAIHAIGDRALDLAMDAVETAVREEKPVKGLPVRIIHAQVVRRDQLARLKRLPVVLDVQPVFLCTDLYWIESRLGKKRMADTYLWKTLMENGLILAGGSDCPVEEYDPLKGIYAAVTRQDGNGFPPGGWQPSEKLSVYEALCLFTKNIARTTGDEDVLGTIEPGKFADFTVLEEDPFEVLPGRLKDIRIAMTFVAGELVFKRE
jgi:hypothetical protein